MFGGLAIGAQGAVMRYTVPVMRIAKAPSKKCDVEILDAWHTASLEEPKLVVCTRYTSMCLNLHLVRQVMYVLICVPCCTSNCSVTAIVSYNISVPSCACTFSVKSDFRSWANLLPVRCDGVEPKHIRRGRIEIAYGDTNLRRRRRRRWCYRF